ncbi:MAG: efflux RND transporter permease subunit [Candidatus Auribacterota bacterium]|nr:efflux RND transporter permease subunit [Candidatus Auribacterota bacterium]
MTEKNNAQSASIIDGLIKFCLEKKVIVFLVTLLFIAWGILVAPFDWHIPGIQRDPVPVDAIPDIGENQQIVFTQWPGRSPQDIEDQITYPLTVNLLGIPSIKTIRSYSMFGFSMIYVIFEESAGFYWSRSRILEKLNSLPASVLPDNVTPMLGPDATALGQVFWYTLEGQDKDGNPAGGWELQELRTIQDWYVRYALSAAEGVSEVASVGGFVKEYQIDIDPDAMRVYDVTLDHLIRAVKNANLDVGARTIEVNNVEYVIRGVGFVKNIADLENSVVAVRDNIPVYLKNVAHVTLGPALRRGVLDKEGAEAVGGVVVARYGANPLETIRNVKKRIEEISPGLPAKTLADGTQSKVSIVPFYDRTGLIYETLGTLNTALILQIIVTVLVILVMLMHLKSSIMISGLLPLAVLMCFIAMKLFGVDANIVALSGIAIAIGTMVDMGIVICENIIQHLKAEPDEDSKQVIFRASSEVAGAVLTAIATTIIGFLPVFALEAAEGKLFKPLAFTKIFALFASLIVAICIIPPVAHVILAKRKKSILLSTTVYILLLTAGGHVFLSYSRLIGAVVIAVTAYHLLLKFLPDRWIPSAKRFSPFVMPIAVALLLTDYWLPLGPAAGFIWNLFFILGIVGGLLGIFYLFHKFYSDMLKWCLDHKTLFLSIPILIMLVASNIWMGFDTIFGWIPDSVKRTPVISALWHAFPGLGKEFMPPLDEGSFLFMPTTMPHASIGEVYDVLRKQDMAMYTIPEIDTVVGKLGRAETPLDPAPISMIETIIHYKPEFIVDKSGRRLTFKYESNKNDLFRDENGVALLAPDGEPYIVRGKFTRSSDGKLIPDPSGIPFRLWRPALDPSLNQDREYWKGINSPSDIWDTIVQTVDIPGTTSAPKLQPISARIVMLQSGMRAPMGVKVKGPDLESIEKVGIEIEKFLKEVPSVNPPTVNADRIIGKPYLEINIDRNAIARYGIQIAAVQQVIEVAIGGKPLTASVEGRERYPIRLRYMRELRDSIESLERILVPAPDGAQIPLIQLADIQYTQGPQMIKSEDTFLIGYVTFDKKDQFAEVDVVRQAQEYLQKKIQTGEFVVPPGVSYVFAGSYENQVRSERKLRVLVPVALLMIFIILYLQFGSLITSSLVFSGIFVAWAGGFIVLWLYSQPWFMDVSLFGINLRELFQVHQINLSVAVWVGFLALFGIASDDGVVMATYLTESFRSKQTSSVRQIRDAAIEAGNRRVRPCLMTTATTILALLPVLTSRGRGSDIMVPMAIPVFGGMLFELITMFVVPVLYCAWQERRFKTIKSS